MTRTTTTHHAQPGERFAPGAFDRAIGRQITWTDPSGTYPARVVAAVVAEDGLSVEVTTEVDSPLLNAMVGLGE